MISGGAQRPDNEDQHRGEARRGDDPVGEGEPVRPRSMNWRGRNRPSAAAVRQPGEVGVARVRGEEQDEECRHLHGDEQRPLPKTASAMSADDRPVRVLARTVHRGNTCASTGDADEEVGHGSQPRPITTMRDAGVLRNRFLERLHAVGDRLDAGERGAGRASRRAG